MRNNDLELIIGSYALSPNTRILDEHKDGLSNNYSLESLGTKYFLKQYRHTDLDKVREIHQVKQYFAAGGIPIVLPIPNTNRETITVLDGTAFALFPYIEGKHPVRGEPSAQHLRSLAKMLARIHLVSVHTPLVIKDHFKGWAVDGFTEKAESILSIIANKPDRNEFDTQMEQSVLLKQSIVKTNTKTVADFNLPSSTLTHGDYHEFNVFFDDDDEVSWVFDLEKAEMAPRVYELIRSMEYICLDGKFNDQRIQNAILYIREYHQEYPLNKEELSKGIELKYILDAYSLWLAGEHYLNDNNRFDRFFAPSFAALRYFHENLAEFTNRLCEALL
jgi:homoserine kinase type II